MNSDLEKFMKQLEVTLKTKLKFANDNYEKYVKAEGGENLALIQAGKIGILEELIEEICEKRRL